VKRNDAENEDQREHQNDNGINLQSWGFIGVESCMAVSDSFIAICALSPSPIQWNYGEESTIALSPEFEKRNRNP